MIQCEADCIPLVEAAYRLRRNYLAVLNMVLRRELSGFKNSRGRWVVSVADIDRHVAGQTATEGH